MESTNAESAICQRDCDWCVFKKLKVSVLANGPDPRINHDLHQTRSQLKSSITKNPNGQPISYTDKVSRVESSRDIASVCRHPEVKQIALVDLAKMLEVLNGHACGTCG